MGASDNTTGLILAVLSSGFIGSSFILKKKGLKKAAAATGFGAGMLFLFFGSFVMFDLMFCMIGMCWFSV